MTNKESRSINSDPANLKVSYLRDLRIDDVIAEFEAEAADAGVKVQSESHTNQGPYAAPEWLTPTAVVVYVAAPFFGAIVAEAGKDFYHYVLKGPIGRLGHKIAGDRGSKLKRVGPNGVKRRKEKYSLAFSVYARRIEAKTARGTGNYRKRNGACYRAILALVAPHARF